MEAPKTTLYHSELSKRGQVSVLVETDVLNSKYAGKPPYVMLKLDGFSRRYDTENDACAQSLTGLKGREVLLTAFGGRETATIAVGAGGNAPLPQQLPQAQHAPVPQQPPQASQTVTMPARQAPQQAPQQAPSARSENPVALCKRELNKLANGYLFCLAGGEYVRTEFDKGHIDRPMTDEQFQAVVSTLFIAADRRMLFTDIPCGSIEKIN